MTVWGSRPAGPTPLRMSAMAVGETSRDMVVERSARSRMDHALDTVERYAYFVVSELSSGSRLV